MKIYIKGTKDRELQFDIELHFVCNQGVEAAFNPDLTDSELDEVIEETAEEYYISFMETVAYNMESIGFEVLEGPTFSNQTNSKSCYFVLCKGDEYEQLTVKFILNLRISDHRLTTHKRNNKNWNRFEARKKYYEKELDNYRVLNETNPGDMDYGIAEIIISGQKFKTYRQALNHILKRIKEEFQI